MDPATRLLPLTPSAIEEAASAIRQGLPVAVPTETVYGLAADATNGEAVARVYAAKGRPSFNPLIVHVPDRAAAARLARLDAAAVRLAEAFWPGPLTLVLPLRPDSPVAGLVTAGLSTIAIRAPAGRAIRQLLDACQLPLAAPSANRSGSLSPTRAEHVLASLGDRAPLVLDDGPTMHGIESTIVAVGPDWLRLLRPGPVAPAELEAAAELPIELASSGAIEAPGQLASHYAPAKPLRLNADGARPGEWLIGFGTVPSDDMLSAAGDLTEAAVRLFDALHRADASDAAGIAVAPIPQTGLGIAINDRLRRAAAPR